MGLLRKVHVGDWGGGRALVWEGGGSKQLSRQLTVAWEVEL